MSHRYVGLVSVSRYVSHRCFRPSVCVGRVVSRGHERHLHVQVFLALVGALGSVAATSGRAFVHQRYEKAAGHETSCGMQILDPHAL